MLIYREVITLTNRLLTASKNLLTKKLRKIKLSLLHLNYNPNEMAAVMLLTKWESGGVNPKPLGEELMARLDVSDRGDSPRAKIIELGGLKDTTASSSR